MKDVKNSIFAGSMKSMLSFFAQNEEVSEEDLEEMIEMIKKTPSNSPSMGRIIVNSQLSNSK
jgi:predicted transcriptional regulator